MADLIVNGTINIRGIDYTFTSERGQQFKGIGGYKGNGNADGTYGPADALDPNETYWMCGYAVNADGSLALYPYLVYQGDNTARGYYQENVFPYGITYTVTYEGNADNVTGVPSSQTKIQGQDLVLSTDTPTREGYEFQGWRAVYTDGTKQDYLPGDTYAVESNATMWAKWGAIVTYYPGADDGSVTNMPETQTKTYQTNLTLSTTVPVRTNSRFMGWAISQENAEVCNVAYASGATYAEEKTLNLYAVWIPDYDDPTVTNLTLVRCDAEGNATAIGKYINVSFDCTTDAELSVASILITYNGASESIDTSTRSYVIGGSLDPFKEYTVTVKLTDTAELSAQSSATLAAESYIAPSITNVVAMRTNSAYEEDNEGMYAKITFNWDYDDMGGSNSIVSITSYYREMNSGTDFNIPAKVSYDSTDASKVGIVTLEAAELNTGKQYEFIIVVTDQVSSISKYALISHSFFTLKFKDGGKGISIGKASVEDGFEVDMESRFLKDVYINGRKYGENQILWSGASHMNADQTAALSGNVSDQPNGIVLVFSGYDNNDAAERDISINTFFVSKKDIELFPYTEKDGPGGHTFLLGINAGFSDMAAKYLYFTDNMIYGHEGNTSAGANSGITFDNSKYVLRYVIGV